MSIHQPSNIYREQLSSLNHGLALWNPKPVENLHNHISIGDVGYLLENGAFMRLFNVTLPWDDPSNRLLEVPEEYKRLELGHSINVQSDEIRPREYCSHISKVDNIHANTHSEGMGQICFLVEHMEDLILVTGCTLVTSWAAAVFDNSKMSTPASDSAAISLDIEKFNRGGAQFSWRNNRGNVDYDNSYFDPTVEGPVHRDQCVFIRGFRARRILFRTIPMRAAAEPLPDDSDNRRDDEIQVTRIPDGSKCQYRDPLAVILDYIEEKCQEDIMAKDIGDIIAIVHDDDLQFFEGIETVTADAIETFLREKSIPLLIENGAAMLRDPADDRSPDSDDDKVATCHAAAELDGESPQLHTTPIDSSAPRSDKSSFVKDMNDNGREYRNQAIELISICRSFTLAQEQTRRSYDELRSVQQVADDTLDSATETGKKTTTYMDWKFESATRALSDYESKYHPRLRETTAQRMAEAKAKVKSPSKILKRLIGKMREKPMMEVEFLLHKSLLDKNPTIVKQILSHNTDINEILWNFSRFKDERRLTLQANPHFYERLPTSAEKYDGQLRIDPIDPSHHNKISVLTDNPRLTGRVFLETAKVKRIFTHVCVPKEAIIFKDVCGKLEGETIIGSFIKNTPNLWCFEEPALYDAHWPSLPDLNSKPPVKTATPITSETGALIGDWREPILRMLRSQGVKINIRISPILPTSSRRSSSDNKYVRITPIL